MLIRQTLLYLPAQFLAPAAQFVSMALWTWWLEPAEMGVFALVAATQELAYLASLSWISVYLLRYLPGVSEPANVDRVLGTETTVLLLALAPQALAAVLTLAVIDAAGGTALLAAVAAYYVTRSAAVHYAERARAQNAILAYTILQAGGPVGGLVLGLAAVMAADPTATVLLAAYAIAQALTVLLALPLIGVRRPRLPDREVIRAAAGYGGPVLLLSGLGWLAENNIRYVVEHAAGAAAFGLLAVGWGLGRRAASFAAMLVTAAAFPLAARLINAGDRESALRQMGINAALLAGVLLPAVTGLVFVGGPLTDLVVAEPYRAVTRSVLALAALSGAIHFLHVHVTGQLFILERRFRYAALVDGVEVVATTAGSAIGLATHGLVGAVAGAAVGSAIAGAVSLVLAMGPLGLRLPLADLGRVAAATAVMALGLSALPTLEGVVGLAIMVAAGGALYTAALALLYARRIGPLLAARRTRTAGAA